MLFSRSRHSLTLDILQTAKNSTSVNCEEETVPKLSNGARKSVANIFALFCSQQSQMVTLQYGAKILRKISTVWVEMHQRYIQTDRQTDGTAMPIVERTTCYSATYTSQTLDQQRFAISEVAADWHVPMVPQCIMWPFITRANRQLDPRCR